MPVEDSKTCTKCGATKPLDAFYKQRDGRYGVRGDCKACVLAARVTERIENPDRMVAREKARYAKFKERRKAEARRWAAANRERRLAVQKAYYEANPEKHAAWSAKRRAAKRGAEHQPYTRREIYDRDGGYCKLCGVALPYQPNGFHLDHIVPLALGGADTPANLQLACQPCNRSKWMNLEGQIHLPV